MDKVAGVGDMKKRKKTKKKGRPSLLDKRMRILKNDNYNNINTNKPPISNSYNPNLGRRSTRRNPNLDLESSDSDSDERKEKKSKLVERLSTSNPTSHYSDSGEINVSPDRSTAADDNVVAKDEKVTEAVQGSPLEYGPTVPLPDKKLVFILERLQKKDTYGVFSEPVDPDELPDYHEIIKSPMDFGTLRKKLDEGSYSNLDDFESDVVLICTNAMQYNAPDTVYYRQAKTILDIAKRDMQYLRQVNDEGEAQPRIVKRGRPPNLNKVLHSSLERFAPESSSDAATLATAADHNINTNNNNYSSSNAAGSNSYNLRKGLPSFRLQSTDAFFTASPQSRTNETYNNHRTDWNSEFPAKIIKAVAKHGKKQLSMDENRRDCDTYKQFHSSSLATLLNGKMKQLMGVGLYSDHGYAKSLARFAAKLGPVAWKMASKKIESALPSGLNYGPGWVDEKEEALPPQPRPHHHSGQASQFQNGNNGYNHQLPGYDYSTQAKMLRTRLQSALRETHYSTCNPPCMDASTSKSRQLFSAPASQNVPCQQHRPCNTSDFPVPPDLNMRFQEPASSNSSFPIGSPQPDLGLQL